MERLIEPVLPADLLEHLRVALLAGHRQRRVARQQLLQAEDDHRHDEQRRDQLQQALAEEQEHVASTYLRYAASVVESLAAMRIKA